jgi:hypothetical protein
MHATILSLLLAAVAGQPAAPSSEGTSTKRATRIYVRTTPPGASIVLDGEQLGTSDGLFLVPPGIRKITLEMDGYDPQAKSVDVREGWITRVEVRMNRRGNKQRALERTRSTAVSQRSVEGPGDLESTGRKEAESQSAATSSSAVAESRSVAALEFRVLASQEEAEALAETGKDLGWYELATEQKDEMVVRDHGQQQQILLWQTPDKSMTASRTGQKKWRIIAVSTMAEPNRAPHIGVVFDKEGGRRLRELTAGNVGRWMAMLVNGRVVSCPKIMSPVSSRVEITGRFSKSDLTRLTTALQAGMETDEPSAPTP